MNVGSEAMWQVKSHAGAQFKRRQEPALNGKSVPHLGGSNSRRQATGLLRGTR